MEKITDKVHLEDFPSVSIIIPVKNGEKNIKKCIVSLEQSDYPRIKYEIIIVDGGSTDSTVDIIKKLQKDYGNIRLIQAEGANTSLGRNIGVKEASGTIIINFSGHATSEKNFIKVLSNKLQSSDNDVAGVGCRDKIPADQTSFIAKSIDCIVNTVLGGTMMHQHAKIEGEKFVDSISFTAYKKEIFRKIGYFNPVLPSGDDAEFNLRLRKSGYKLLYTPDTTVYRYRRETIRGFLKQMFNYGRVRMQIIKQYPESLRFPYVIPILFVGYLLISPVIIFINNTIILNIFLLGALIYISILLLFSIKISFLKKEPKFIIICPLLYVIQHCAYGLGLLLGIFRKKIAVKY